MTNDHRRKAKRQLDQLLDYWRQIEYWLKRAEQVSYDACVPAINELRYASRQLLNAVRVYGKHKLTPGDISVLRKRIVIAEQYMLNADHDICDAVVKYFAKSIHDAEKQVPVERIHVHFNEYASYKGSVQEANRLIVETRSEYDKRAENYHAIQTRIIPDLITLYPKFENGAASAIYEQRELSVQLERAKAKAKILGFFPILTGLASMISVPLAIGLWLKPVDDFCEKTTWEPTIALCNFSGYKASTNMPPSTEEASR